MLTHRIEVYSDGAEYFCEIQVFDLKTGTHSSSWTLTHKTVALAIDAAKSKVIKPPVKII